MREFSAPNSFWKYYDLYRRQIITIADYSALSCIPEKDLVKLLLALSNSQKGVE